MSIDLNDPSVKDAIAAAVAEEVKGLKAKNEELFQKLKEANKGRQIDPAEVQKLELQVDELQAQLTEAQKAAKTAMKEAEKANKALADAEGFTQKLLVDNGLTDALTKAGVSNPVHLKAAKALLNGQVQIAQDGDNKVAKVGDKALSDFISEWAKGDEGKFFVAAPNNSGGGANGGAGGSGVKTTDLSKIDPNDRAARIAALEKRVADAQASS